jgi:hypothetical protein
MARGSWPATAPVWVDLGRPAAAVLSMHKCLVQEKLAMRDSRLAACGADVLGGWGRPGLGVSCLEIAGLNGIRSGAPMFFIGQFGFTSYADYYHHVYDFSFHGEVS